MARKRRRRMVKFAYPWFLLLIPVVVFITYLRWKRRGASLKFSTLQNIPTKKGISMRIDQLFLVAKTVAIIFFVIAVARPRKGLTKTEISSRGIDIVIALDISGSMEAIDFKPENRLYVAKEVAENFIKNRKTDRIGLVLFARYAYTQCPLTTDHGVVIDLLRKSKIGMIEDGTAIGLGLAQSCDRLKNSKAKSKVVILLTDGRNNAGEIDPEMAIKIAEALGVKVYTIGAGKPGETMMPVKHPIWGKRYVKVEEELDEELLSEIAKKTGGNYFRAKDPEGLVTIFDRIDKMEKSEVKVHKYTNYREYFRPIIFAGFLILIAGVILENTRFLKFP
jgi:Ca-activated chloride channel family protein